LRGRKMFAIAALAFSNESGSPAVVSTCWGFESLRHINKSRIQCNRRRKPLQVLNLNNSEPIQLILKLKKLTPMVFTTGIRECLWQACGRLNLLGLRVSAPDSKVSLRTMMI
jgi:hypothetical protein